MTNNITNNNPYGAVPPGQYVQVQNSTEGESTTSQVAKRKFEDFQAQNSDLAQQNPEEIKHQKIEPTPTDIFPYELWMYLFSFADFKTLSSLRGVSKEFRVIVHKTLEYGLRVMNPMVLTYIRRASKTWMNFTITVKINRKEPHLTDQKEFNLNPIRTELFRYSVPAIDLKFCADDQLRLLDWYEVYRLTCVFLKRAPNLTALDLSKSWKDDKNKDEFDINHSDLRRMISNVSSLERLDLSDNFLEVSAVLETLKTHGFALKTLFLECTFLQSKELTTIDLNDLPKTLRSLNLDSLRKMKNQIPLFQLTGDFPTSLTELSLANNIFPKSSLPALSSSLKYLNLSALRIKDEEVKDEEVIGPFFEERSLSIIGNLPFQSLKILTLKDNFLTDEALQIILQNPDSPLEKIDLSMNFITLEKTIAALPSRLKRLNLDSNAIRRLDQLYCLVLKALIVAPSSSLEEISIKDNLLDAGVFEEFIPQVTKLFKW
jgi:hypothetical protein